MPSLRRPPSINAWTARDPLALPVVIAVLLPGAGAAAVPPAWKALSYNLWYEQPDPAASLEVIGKVDADVVGLQELTPRFSRHFASRLGRVYAHRRFEKREGTWGVGIASKHPLEGATAPHRMPAMQTTVVRGRPRGS